MKFPCWRSPLLLGDDLLPLLGLAFGAAMALGSGLALVRPPERKQEGALDRAPVMRSVAMIAIGTIAAVWAIASLLS